MTSLRPCRWSHLPGVALALLACGAFAPAAVRAACGDYVVMGHTPTRPMADAAMPAHPAPPAKHAPCSGPNCSQRPFAPPATPVAPTTPTAPEWACLHVPPSAPADPTRHLPADDGATPPAGPRATVYHPPR